MGKPPLPGLQIDHIDGDGLNNRRTNLRWATQSQNFANRRPMEGTSKFKGVSRFRRKWQVKVKLNRESHWVGLFDDEVEAAKAYDAAAIRLFGEYARLNFPGRKEV